MKLEACPFCESDNIDGSDIAGGGWVTECNDCGAEMMGDTQLDSIEKWNTRPPKRRLANLIDKAAFLAVLDLCPMPWCGFCHCYHHGTMRHIVHRNFPRPHQ